MQALTNRFLSEPGWPYSALGKTTEERAIAYRELFKGQIGGNLETQIRVATNRGMVLGNDRFKQDIEKLSGRRVTINKRGPKPKVKPVVD